MAYALSLSGLLTTFRHHFVQRPHAQWKFNCFNPTARACYVTFARQFNTTMGVFDWASSVTYVLTDWTFLTILYSTGTGNEAM